MRVADTINLTFAGVAVEGCNNLSGSDAAKWCRVYQAGIFRFKAFTADIYVHVDRDDVHRTHKQFSPFSKLMLEAGTA